MTEQIFGSQEPKSTIEFDAEGFHHFSLPADCKFLVSARVNRYLYKQNPNSLFVEFKNGYLAEFKSDDVAEHMFGNLDQELESVPLVKRVMNEDRELFIIQFEPGTDVQKLLKDIDDKVVEVSQWDELPE